MTRPRKSGASVVEGALLVPVLLLLLVGGMEFGRIALTYYTLEKTLHGAAGMASVLRGADFCAAADPQLSAVRDFVVFGPNGTTALPVVTGLTSDSIVFTPERVDPINGSVSDCYCGGGNGCSIADGGRSPDFVRVSINGGYPFQPQIPYHTFDTIYLVPEVRVPFEGQ